MESQSHSGSNKLHLQRLEEVARLAEKIEEVAGTLKW
jgi:hypothetical protein